MCLYIVDILIFGISIKIINDTKSFLSSTFDMKDLGLVDAILGIKLIRLLQGISIT